MKKEINYNELFKVTTTKEMLETSIDKGSQKNFYGHDSFTEMQKSINRPFKRNCTNDNSMIDTSQIYLDVAGFAPSVPKFLNGDPENMYNFEMTETVNYHEFNFYLSIPFTVSAEQINENGQFLAQYLQKNTSSKDRFKVTFNCFFGKIFIKETGKRVNDCNIDLKIIVSDYNDYLTDNILNNICEPTFFRVNVLNGISSAYGYKGNVLNGYPVFFGEARKKDSTLMNFMDMKNELEKYGN